MIFRDKPFSHDSDRPLSEQFCKVLTPSSSYKIKNLLSIIFTLPTSRIISFFVVIQLWDSVLHDAIVAILPRAALFGGGADLPSLLSVAG
jgi:ABC-type sugar transport system permease subunit